VFAKQNSAPAESNHRQAVLRGELPKCGALSPGLVPEPLHRPVGISERADSAWIGWLFHDSPRQFERIATRRNRVSQNFGEILGFSLLLPPSCYLAPRCLERTHRDSLSGHLFNFSRPRAVIYVHRLGEVLETPQIVLRRC